VKYVDIFYYEGPRDAGKRSVACFGMERASMKADRWPLARAGFDGENVKAVGCRFRTACAEELASHARQRVPFVRRDGHFGRGLIALAHHARLHFDERKDFAVVADQVALAFHRR